VNIAMRRWLSFIYYALLFLTFFFFWGVGRMVHLAPRPEDVNLFDGRFWLHNWSGALLGTFAVAWPLITERRRKRKDERKPAEPLKLKSFRLAPMNWRPAEVPQGADRPASVSRPILAFDFLLLFVIGGLWLTPHLPPHYAKPLILSDPRFWWTNWAGALLGIFMCAMRYLSVEVRNRKRGETVDGERLR
jgi:hypothetical protein